MKTFHRIILASAAALALTAVPMLASAATGTDAMSSTKSAPCDCAARHGGGGSHCASAADARKASDARKDGSRDRQAERAFEQQVWTAP